MNNDEVETHLYGFISGEDDTNISNNILENMHQQVPPQPSLQSNSLGSQFTAGVILQCLEGSIENQCLFCL